MSAPLDNGAPADVAILGAGPTGLFAAFYAGLRQMSIKLIDSLDVPGGQLATLYPEKYIYDVAGFPRVLAKELVARLVEQAMQYHPQLCLGCAVQTLEVDDAGIFTLRGPRAEHRARSIVIAAGIGAFSPKKLPIPECRIYEGRGLCYGVQHLADFAGKRVLIVGGGDSAVDWANALAPLTRQQTLIHRRDAFRAHEDSVVQMKNGPTRILTFFELAAIEGTGGVQRAVIYDNRTKERQTLEVDAILVNVGFESSLGPIKNWGLDLELNQIKVDTTMQTSRSGIFAAGDVCAYPGKLKLIATGFGEAATAVNHAKKHLDPAARLFPGHSSEMGASAVKV